MGRGDAVGELCAALEPVGPEVVVLQALDIEVLYAAVLGSVGRAQTYSIPPCPNVAQSDGRTRWQDTADDRHRCHSCY